LDKAEFEQIKVLAGGFLHSSLEYLDYEEVTDYRVESAHEDIVLLLGYDTESGIWHYHWAANGAAILVPLLTCPEPFLLTFVPEEWVPELESAGLKVRNKWHDYFRASLADIEHISNVEPDFLSTDEVDEASAVTMQCRGQTRGFTGQTAAWIENWLQGDENVKNPAVLVHRLPGGDIAGILCVGTYGHENKDGAIVWIREVAVSPAYQGQGVGRKLVTQALRYGKRCGATRAFLAVDEKNLGAIHLYESLGFVASEEPGEINMIKE
jgi:ribosomal protein S18 acetylase RimI-like enzyme